MEWEDLRSTLGADIERLENELRSVHTYYETKIKEARENDILKAVQALGRRLAAIEERLDKEDDE
jgi:hypothetical protein